MAVEYHGVRTSFPRRQRDGVGIPEANGRAMEGAFLDFFVQPDMIIILILLCSNTKKKANGFMNSMRSGVQAIPTGICTPRHQIFSFTCPNQTSLFSKVT